MKTHDSGTVAQPDPPKTPEGLRARISLAVMAFFMTLFALLRSITRRVKLPSTPPDVDQNISEVAPDNTQKEEFRPPSPTPAFTEADLLSSVMKRLGELEEKVDTLKAKPSEMPYEKAELLNAAVCRVDALEAELIATKKVLLLFLVKNSLLFLFVPFSLGDSFMCHHYHIVLILFILAIL